MFKKKSSSKIQKEDEVTNNPLISTTSNNAYNEHTHTQTHTNIQHTAYNNMKVVPVTLVVNLLVSIACLHVQKSHCVPTDGNCILIIEQLISCFRVRQVSVKKIISKIFLKNCLWMQT